MQLSSFCSQFVETLPTKLLKAVSFVTAYNKGFSGNNNKNTLLQTAVLF